MSNRTRKKIVNIPTEYLEAIDIGVPIFSHLFQFENALRIVINNYLELCYGINWWEDSLKFRLQKIYNYASNIKTKQDYMPWIGDSARVQVLPIHTITLGQLEKIVQEYKSDCIPEIFPTWEFFSGHLEIVKRVRNLFSHMYPCITNRDVSIAKNEINLLCEQLNHRLQS